MLPWFLCSDIRHRFPKGREVRIKSLMIYFITESDMTCPTDKLIWIIASARPSPTICKICLSHSLCMTLCASIGSISEEGLGKVRSLPYQAPSFSELESACSIFMAIKILAYPDTRLASFLVQNKSTEK